MQKLMTKLKMELESCWWLWIPKVWDPDGKEEAQEEIKKSRFPDQKWLNGQQRSPEEGKEPHPGSITDKRLTVSDRKKATEWNHQ